MNHRHEDFQSTALPLSYPGMIIHINNQGGYISKISPCLEIFYFDCKYLMIFLLTLLFFTRDNISIAKPAIKINISAAIRAKWVIFIHRLAFAYRAFSFWFKIGNFFTHFQKYNLTIK